MDNQKEQIDLYLRNEMSSGETQDFEILISQNPALRAEVDFQRTVVNSLKEYRKTQLKIRLSQIEVSPMNPFWQSGFVKTAVAVSIVTGVGIGVFLYDVNPNEHLGEMISSGGPLNITRPLSPKFSEIYFEMKEISETSPQLKEEEVEKQQSEEIVDTQPLEKKDFSLVLDVPTDQKIEDDELFEAPEIKEELVEIDEEANKPQLEVEQKATEDEILKYRYFSGKLSLYGNFSGNPYEILEINTRKGRAVYLLFDLQYYALVSTNEIIELSVLEDPSVIEQLEIIRSEK